MSNPAPPPQCCDLLMKGGITSGVVYPKAAAGLAKVYTFKNIGGTSAGAIAAAVTAAAEYARQGGSSKSFDMLAGVPEWLGTGGRLFNMFAPDSSTKALFALLTAPMRASSTIGKVFAVLGTVLRHFFLSVLTGVLISAGIAYMAERTMGGTGRPLGDALAVLVGVIAFATVLFLQIKRQALRRLPENFYGLSKAFDPNGTSAEGPLVNWLSEFLDHLGGKDPSGPPLTFGDLLSRGVNLEVMTTALNHGRPYRLPFRDPDRVFYFSPTEFRTLFPERVVKQMMEHAPKREGIPPIGPGGGQMVAFPDAANLPVVVATRMSQFSNPDFRRPAVRGRFHPQDEPSARRGSNRGAVLVLRWKHFQQHADPLLRPGYPALAHIRHQPEGFSSRFSGGSGRGLAADAEQFRLAHALDPF